MHQGDHVQGPSRPIVGSWPLDGFMIYKDNPQGGHSIIKLKTTCKQSFLLLYYMPYINIKILIFFYIYITIIISFVYFFEICSHLHVWNYWWSHVILLVISIPCISKHQTHVPYLTTFWEYWEMPSKLYMKGLSNLLKWRTITHSKSQAYSYQTTIIFNLSNGSRMKLISSPH